MKKRGLLLLILIGTVLIGGLTRFLIWEPNPTQLVTHGLEKLNGATSFRYTLTQHQWVEGKDRVLSQILGERDGGNVHIQGQLVGSQVEMVVIGDTMYNKDPFSKNWVRFASTPAVQEVFLAELNPLSSLQFKELGEVVLRGQEKLNGEKVWVCQLRPSIQNQLMEEFWSDFSYTLYISKDNKTVVKAVIEAKSKQKAEPMQITIEFKDIGKKVQVNQPVK